ncbi:aldo/keto reductase [Gemmatimonadota bacterium]
MGRAKINRRGFISRLGLGAASAGLGLQVAPEVAGQGGQEPRVLTRPLGKTGLELPVVSIGVMNTYEEAIIHHAIRLGVRHLDTAWIYLDGQSELAIGRVLKENGRRSEITIATKMRFNRDRESLAFLPNGNGREMGASASNLDRQLDMSLERLQTDHVDLLYLHSCYSPGMATNAELMNALVRVKEEGRARFIGVSTHHDVPVVTRAAVDAGVYDVVQIAYNYRSVDGEAIREANAHAAENGVGIVAMKVMGGNDLNASGVQIDHKAALKWVLDDGNVSTIIPGVTTFAQLDLNWSVMSDPALTAREDRELQLASQVRDPLYCQNCRSCVATCPERVEIPNLMRAYMYEVGYGNQWQTRRTLAEIPVEHGLDRCRECGLCTAACRHGLEIGERLTALMEI